MHLEILPLSRPEHPETLLSDLEHGLLEVLRLVEEVVQDWSRMRTRSVETITMLWKAAVSDGRQDEAALATELLEAQRQPLHLPRLPAVPPRTKITPADSSPCRRPVWASCGRHRSPGAFHALPRPGSSPELMIITKDNEVAGSPAGVP